MLQFSTAKTVAGQIEDKATGFVLINEKTGQREWIEGISRQGAGQTIARRTGSWIAREYGFRGAQLCIFA